MSSVKYRSYESATRVMLRGIRVRILDGSSDGPVSNRPGSAHFNLKQVDTLGNLIRYQPRHVNTFKYSALGRYDAHKLSTFPLLQSHDGGLRP
jgi:hypothetical protein